ncbi:hypothetical protein DMA37_24890, partial [Salmonella enterica subsp. enterica serovar Vuadens]|nr:hypothetical protein [Salmonella enterica subsp. enterica serovar Vuadens]
CADFPALNPVSPASLDYLCGINSVVILSPSSSLTNETSFTLPFECCERTASYADIVTALRFL